MTPQLTTLVLQLIAGFMMVGTVVSIAFWITTQNPDRP